MRHLRPIALGCLLALSLAGHARAEVGDARAERGEKDRAAKNDLEGRGTTVTFPFEQKRYLYSRNGKGGVAYVPAGADVTSPLPVVVFLHGMNAFGRVHPHFDGQADDLRPVLDELVRDGKTAPFVVAAPTHTRYAFSAKVMFPDFDLSSLLDSTERALAGTVAIDRSRVIVVGHSGGGCNARGGLFSVDATQVRALLAVDTCLDADVAPLLVDRMRKTDTRVFWQRGWPRPFERFTEECEAALAGDRAQGRPEREGMERLAAPPGDRRCRVQEVTSLDKHAPHVAILAAVLREALPELLPQPPRAHAVATR